MTTPASPAGRDFRDEAGNPIVPGRQIGVGGEGTIYLVDGQPGSVMKIWHPDETPDEADAKIAYLVKNPVKPDLGATWSITWPESAVKEGGVIVGYTMPIYQGDPGEWVSMEQYYVRRSVRETGEAQNRTIQIDDQVRMARNLALGFKAVHEAGYVIGDVNEKNVVVNRQNDITLVDCDSYSFTDPATGRTYSNNKGRAEFQAPEVQGGYVDRTRNHDYFGLAILIFHLLTGTHPYRITGSHARDYTDPGSRIEAWLFPPARRDVSAPPDYNKAWDALTDKQQELFLRCFDQKYEGDPRPTPEEWIEALRELPAVVTPPAPPAPAPASPGPPPASPGPPPARPAPTPPSPAPTPPSPRPRPAPTPGPRAGGGGVTGAFFRRLSLRHILLTGVASPVVALVALYLYSRHSYVPKGDAIGTVALLLVMLFINHVVYMLAGIPGLWWGLSPLVALGLLLLIGRRTTISRRVVVWTAGTYGAYVAGALILALFQGLIIPAWNEWRSGGEQAQEQTASVSGNVAEARNTTLGGSVVGGSAPVIAPTDTPIPASAPAAAPPAEPVCGPPTNFRAGAFNANDRSLIYSWDAPAVSDLTVTGYQTESREVFADGTYADWERRGPLGAGEIYQAVGPYPSDIDGRTFQNRVYALCDSVYSEPSEHVPFTYPAAVAAAVPTDTPASTPAPEPTATSEPTPTSTPAATATPAPLPTATPLPPATVPPATRTPNQWLIQHPANPKIANSPAGAHVLVQGCYLGNRTSDRRFRLASWDVWDPGRYGNELKFVRIVTNTGANLPLERGACYEARLVKQVDSTEEYVCLDQGSIHPQQTPCANAREREVIPTFILYPSSADNPDDYSDNFGMIRQPP